MYVLVWLLEMCKMHIKFVFETSHMTQGLHMCDIIKKHVKKNIDDEMCNMETSILCIDVWRGGGQGSRPIFKKFNEPYAPS